MNSKKIRTLVEGAVMVALAFVLSCVKVYKMPWGGSVTLVSMLPIVVFSIRNGVAKGFGCSFVYALTQLVQGIAADGLLGWGLTPVMLIACIFFDYIFAFTILGISGMFRDKGIGGWTFGTLIAILLRFASHVLSGVVVFHSAGKLWEGFDTSNSWLYSIVYNGAYMLPELIVTIIAAVIIFKSGAVKVLFS